MSSSLPERRPESPAMPSASSPSPPPSAIPSAVAPAVANPFDGPDSPPPASTAEPQHAPSTGQTEQPADPRVAALKAMFPDFDEQILCVRTVPSTGLSLIFTQAVCTRLCQWQSGPRHRHAARHERSRIQGDCSTRGSLASASTCIHSPSFTMSSLSSDARRPRRGIRPPTHARGARSQ